MYKNQYIMLNSFILFYKKSVDKKNNIILYSYSTSEYYIIKYNVIFKIKNLATCITPESHLNHKCHVASVIIFAYNFIFSYQEFSMAKASKTVIKSIEDQLARLDLQTTPLNQADDVFLALLDDSEDDNKATAKRGNVDKLNDYDFSEQLAIQDRDSQLQQALSDTVLSLSDYLSAVQLVISETFAHTVWVKAEIRSLSAKGGHYYFELADKDMDGKVTASCRGTLWRGQAAKVLSKFEKNTGMSLERGLNVLLKVSATFHAQYGFSLNIVDIDPTYTLGDLAKQYQMILTRLHEEGLLDLNKSLPMPFDIEHVLVIAPEKAAGLGDFRADADRLASTGACIFHYEHATFQGNHAPEDIRQALIKGMKNLSKQHITADLIVIIRGGGAVGDLAYLNDYELAALVAEQPIPVWVGIGHERDRVMLDEVAHQSFDTPSKVIAGIRNHLLTITQAAKQHFLTIEQIAKSNILQARRDSEQQLTKIQSAAQRQLSAARLAMDNQFIQIRQLAYQQITTARQSTNQLREMTLLQHPSTVLTRGYAIIRTLHPALNMVMTSIAQVEPNTTITIELQDGYLQATVNAKQSKN